MVGRKQAPETLLPIQSAKIPWEVEVWLSVLANNRTRRNKAHLLHLETLFFLQNMIHWPLLQTWKGDHASTFCLI